MTLMQVVLPEPFGPTSPRISPLPMVKLRLSRARKPPKRFTTPLTCNSGAGSGDIDAPALQQRDQPIRQEQHQPHDQRSVDELKVLRRRNADRVVDAVEHDHAEDRSDDGGIAAE